MTAFDAALHYLVGVLIVAGCIAVGFFAVFVLGLVWLCVKARRG